MYGPAPTYRQIAESYGVGSGPSKAQRVADLPEKPEVEAKPVVDLAALLAEYRRVELPKMLNHPCEGVRLVTLLHLAEVRVVLKP